MIQELFQLYADRWQFFLKLTLQHLEISLIAIVAAQVHLGLFISLLIAPIAAKQGAQRRLNVRNENPASFVN